MTNPPELVIFDCDGVLVDTEYLSVEVIAANLTRQGHPTAPGDVAELFVGGTVPSAAEELRARGIPLPDSWPDDVYEEIYARLRQGVDLIPGIVDLLDRLDAAGIPYCVGSNGRPEKMEITLGSTGLLPRFNGHLFSGQRIGRPKPAPDIYLHAAESFGLAPARCVVIEDSPRGAAGAQAAGVPCLGYAPEGEDAALSAVGARIFRHMDEVPALLGL